MFNYVYVLKAKRVWSIVDIIHRQCISFEFP